MSGRRLPCRPPRAAVGRRCVPGREPPMEKEPMWSRRLGRGLLREPAGRRVECRRLAAPAWSRPEQGARLSLAAGPQRLIILQASQPAFVFREDVRRSFAAELMVIPFSLEACQLLFLLFPLLHDAVQRLLEIDVTGYDQCNRKPSGHETKAPCYRTHPIEEHVGGSAAEMVHMR